MLAGVGGAFGGREDLSMHVHACMLALHTGKPVKMVYNREESFFGHVHRHPATMRFEHGANRDGTLVFIKAEIYLDGGAYTSSTPAVVGNAGTMGIGPYVVPNVHVDTYGVYTNNPPCGAMRGFGSVQAAFAYEAQMDKLAAELGLDPVELRCRNAMSLGSEAPTGQIVDSPAPVAELLRRLEVMPLPPAGIGEAVTTATARRPPGQHGDGSARRPSGLPRGVWGGRPEAAQSRPARAARRGVQHHARRGRRARRRLRGGLQERRLLRGLRRLLHGHGSGWRSSATSRWRPCTPPRPRSVRAWSPSSSRSAVPSWAWSRS